MEIKKYISALYFVIISFVLCGCKGCFKETVFPSDNMQIDLKFVNIFNSVTQQDSVSFINAVGKRKTFVFLNIDSITHNTKGWGINQAPYKLLISRFREIDNEISGQWNTYSTEF